MTDSDYLDRAEALLRSIEQTVDRINDSTEADIDAQRVGGMVTLVMANRSQVIVNLQKPLQEVWMAAKSGGYHYKFGAAGWVSTRDGTEFFADLSRDVSAQAGMTLLFSPA
jgi:CyaY protein